MAQRTLELLESLISGHEMTRKELDNLVSNKVSEDLHLDYKHGRVLNNKKDAARMLREYIAAFANSAGGILIVGVDAPENEKRSWTVTGCTAPGEGDLRKWATRCLTPIFPYLSPLPQFSVIEHPPQGDVLVVATDRSLGLVPCAERDRKLVYYFRMHDQTLPAPDYLISDLMLGGRRRSYLHIPEFQLIPFPTHRDSAREDHILYFNLHFRVENQGLSCAEDVRLGIISLNRVSTRHDVLTSDYLKSYLEIQLPKDGQIITAGPAVCHNVGTKDSLPPFTAAPIVTNSKFSALLEINDRRYIPYNWWAPVYLSAKNTPPVWYQLKLAVNDELFRCARDSENILSCDTGQLQIERVSGRRPVVSWVWDS